MTIIINYVIDRSPYLLAEVVRMLASVAVFIAVSVFVGIIVFSVSAINSDFFFPRGMFGWNNPNLDTVFFSLFGVSLFVSCACGIYAAEYFYTKALLWEVRMFFRDRVD
jgi:hypothetical protein